MAFRTLVVVLAAGLAHAADQSDPDAEWAVGPKTVRVPTAEATSTAAAFPDDTPADIWKASCAMCHGRDGSARTWLGKRNKVRDLTELGWKAKATTAEVREAIRAGVANTKMKGFESKMSAAQLTELTLWVRALGGTNVASSN